MTVVLLVSTFALGLRHGVDWDHLAAIADITGTEPERRRSAFLAVLYALGHGASVLCLGALAILAGEHLPTWIDPLMERFVGATLIVLAVGLTLSLRRGKPASRGMLLYRGFGAVRERLRQRRRVEIDHAHEHGHDAGHAHDHGDSADADESCEGAVLTRHRHGHVHAVDISRFTAGGAAGVGVLHGIGAETGTQAIVLVTASHVAGGIGGLAVLAAFVTGIVVTTALLAVVTAFGWTAIAGRSRAFVALSASTAFVSAVVGVMFITGNAGSLPAILA